MEEGETLDGGGGYTDLGPGSAIDYPRHPSGGLPDVPAAEAFFTGTWGLRVAARQGDVVYLRGTGAEGGSRHFRQVCKQVGDVHGVGRGDLVARDHIEW